MTTQAPELLPMHHLVIGPRKVTTSCGIRVSAYYPNSQTGMPSKDGPNIRCCESPDFHKVIVTCPRCLER